MVIRSAADSDKINYWFFVEAFCKKGGIPINLHTVEPIRWTDSGVVILDQTRLPRDVVYHTHTDYHEVAKALRDTIVRGAPRQRGRHELRNPAREGRELLVRSEPGGMTAPANIFGSPLGGAEPCNRTAASTNVRKIPETTHRFLTSSTSNLISLRIESPPIHTLIASCTEECES